MLEFLPIKNKGFNWHKVGSCWAKGYAYDNGKFLSGNDLAIFFEVQFNASTTTADTLSDVNGCFSVVLINEEKAVAAVDKFRSFPLFWSEKEGKTIISDDANVLREITGALKIDPVSATEFKRIYCVSGKHTLLNNIFQISAGNFLHFKKNTLHYNSYWKHYHSKDYSFDKQKLEDELSTVCDNAFSRLIDSLHGRTAVIPLSGGYDSRLIAVMLKKLGYENVMCYTYGRRNGYEAVWAKKVATELGFPWHFVEYNPNLLSQYFIMDAQAYREFAFNYVSLPHEQDYFALLELTKAKVIPDNSIFIPGFCGDLLAGSYLPDAFTTQKISPSRQALADYIIKRIYEPDNQGNEDLKERVFQQISSPENIEEFISFFEAWFTINKVSNYIVNAVKVYEHFGFEWRMPLWDDEWMRLWYSVPNKFREDKSLYKSWMNKTLLNHYNISGEPAIIDKYYGHKGLLTRLKYIVPKNIRQLLKPIFVPAKVQDVNNLDPLKELLANKLTHPVNLKGKSLNYINAMWELEKLNKN